MSGALTALVLAAATAAIVVILILTARGRRRRKRGDRDEAAAASGRRWPCPVCGALLGPGERIKSVIRVSTNHDRLMDIYGCPHCLPPSTRRRTCPVCKAELDPADVLTARMLDPTPRRHRPHVHVLGCRRCRGRAS